MPIKPPAERRLIGKDVVALDVPWKVNGRGRYGLDAAVDGMIYARPIIPRRATAPRSSQLTIGGQTAARLYSKHRSG